MVKRISHCTAPRGNNISFVNIDVDNYIILRKGNVDVIFLNFFSTENRLRLQCYENQRGEQHEKIYGTF